MAPKRVLFVTYAFPPRGGVAVQRILSFVQHFPAYGLEPIVLTVWPPRGTVQYDPSLMGEIPGAAQVIRTTTFEPYRLYRAMGGRRPQDDAALRSDDGAGGGGLYQRFSDRFLIPDAKIGWFPLAMDAARVLEAEGGADLVVGSNPPASALVIGGAIAQRWQVPLVLDYRDPWTGGYYEGGKSEGVRQREQQLEARLLQQAAAVVTVGAGFAGAITGVAKESEPILDKLRIVGNGYQEQNFTDLDSFPFDRPALVHAGSLYHQRSPEPLLGAIALLRTQEPALWNHAEMRWVGNVDSSYLRLAAELGISNLIHEGFVDHRTALRYQLGADLLLLMTEGMLTGKIYEYLRAGRPLLAIGDSPEVAALLEQYGAGQLFARDDIAGIAEYIATILRRRERTGPKEPKRWPGIEVHERGALAAQFAAICNAAIEGESLPGTPPVTAGAAAVAG